MTRRVVVGRKKQNRETVDRRQSCPCHHIGGTWTDGGRTGEGGQPLPGLGIGGCGVHHRLLVPRLIVPQLISAFLQRLSYPSNVPVTEDAENSRDQALAPAIPLRELLLQIADQRLCGRKTNGLILPALFRFEFC